MNFFSLNKQVLKYAIPMIATNLLTIIGGVISNWLLAQTNNLHNLSAFAIANTLFTVVSACFGSCLYAVSIKVSSAVANGDSFLIKKTISNGMYLSIILSIPASIILLTGCYWLKLFGQDIILINLTGDFFLYIAIAMPILMLGTAISQVYTGMGNPAFSTLITIARLPVLIVLNFYFINYTTDVVGGIAKAFFYLQLISLIAIIGVIYFSKMANFINLKSFRWYSYPEIKQQFTLGINIGLQFLGELGAISGFTYLIGSLGSIVLATRQIVGQYSILLVMIILGLSRATSIVVSIASASKNIKLADNYRKTSLILLTMIFLILGSMAILFAKPLLMLFIAKNSYRTEIIKLGIPLMIIGIINLFFDGIKNIYADSLRGFGNSKTPMLIGVFSLWLIGMPLSYITGIIYNSGAITMSIAFGFGYVCSAIITAYYYKRFLTTVG